MSSRHSSPLAKLAKQIAVAAVSYVIFNIIFVGIYYKMTKSYPDEQHWSVSNDKMKNIDNLFYYSSTVTSTVGFGDIYPVSKKMKRITMIHQFLVAIGFIGMVLNFGSIKKQFVGRQTAYGSTGVTDVPSGESVFSMPSLPFLKSKK